MEPFVDRVVAKLTAKLVQAELQLAIAQTNVEDLVSRLELFTSQDPDRLEQSAAELVSQANRLREVNEEEPAKA